MAERKRKAIDQEPKTKKGRRIKVPLRFDEAMRRALKVPQPGEGRNEDYKKANEEREGGD